MATSRDLAGIRRRPVLRFTLLSLAALILLAGAAAAGCFVCAIHVLGSLTRPVSQNNRTLKAS